ncbi:MAG: hypothetical protein ABIB79_00820 [archaeon]
MITKRRFWIGAIAGGLGGALSHWLVLSQGFNIWKLSLFGAIFGIIITWVVQFIKK